MFRLLGVMEENKRVEKTKKYTVLLIPRQSSTVIKFIVNYTIVVCSQQIIVSDVL